MKQRTVLKERDVVKTRKNFWASAIITSIWIAFIFVTMSLRGSTIGSILPFIGVVAVFLLTYQILRILQYVPDTLEKQQPLRRSQQRMDDLLSDLDDTQLDLLRTRLADREAEDFDSLGDLLAEQRDKRKNR
jgi:hypothetical protein